jgi:hypothetical protein
MHRRRTIIRIADKVSVLRKTLSFRSSLLIAVLELKRSIILHYLF